MYHFCLIIERIGLFVKSKKRFHGTTILSVESFIPVRMEIMLEFYTTFSRNDSFDGAIPSK